MLIPKHKVPHWNILHAHIHISLPGYLNIKDSLKSTTNTSLHYMHSQKCIEHNMHALKALKENVLFSQLPLAIPLNVSSQVKLVEKYLRHYLVL